MHIDKYWSSPEGIFDYKTLKINNQKKMNAKAIDSRIIVFSDREVWERDRSTLAQKEYRGIVIIPGNITGISRIINVLDKTLIQRIIAYNTKTKDTQHNTHNLLLVLNYTEKKRPYREIREKYTYCPICEKSSKDYGGKKHHYPSDGTWIRDVWSKFKLASPVFKDNLFIEAIRNLYCLEETDSITIIDDGSNISVEGIKEIERINARNNETKKIESFTKFGQRIINGDCMEVLPYLASKKEKFDLIFVDPPYNLGKKYDDYDDDITLERYTNWCIEWIKLAYPLLSTNGFFVILNTPLNNMLQLPEITRHYHLIEDIVWDDLAVPVARKMQPTYYSLLILSKNIEKIEPTWYSIREPIYCKRKTCIDDPRSFSEGGSIWSDIHRTRQKSRRWGHPCNLPEELVTRMIEIIKKAVGKEKIEILDFFLGVGTTTMASLITENTSTGVELSEEYYSTAKLRLENRYLTNPDNKKEKRQKNGTKRIIQRLVARSLGKAGRANGGYSTQEQIDWLIENGIVSKRDLDGFVRPGEILKAVGKGGAPGEDEDNQSLLADFE